MAESAYLPSPTGWVRRQVDQIEAAGTTGAVDIMGRDVILLTMRGARTGAVRKVPLMRVEHDGVYAAVASQGGAPTHPQWFHNLTADPHIDLQDGTETFPVTARLISGEEYDAWWQRCVAAYPPYADYVTRAAAAGRRIPVFVLERRPVKSASTHPTGE